MKAKDIALSGELILMARKEMESMDATSKIDRPAMPTNASKHFLRKGAGRHI